VGIRSIREQVQELGGKFDIESSPLGTKLVVSLALAPAAG
jgi:signal transduction histidine kinase